MPRKAFYWAHKDKCNAQNKEYKLNHPEKAKAWKKKSDRNFYIKNRDARLEQTTENGKERFQKQRKELIESLGRCCFLCEQKDSRVLEFHHWNGKTRRGWSNKKLRENDASDLVLLCGNCHNLVHWKRRFVFA